LIGHLLWQMFQWPGGNLIGNLCASAVCFTLGWFAALRKMHCSKPGCFRPGRHPVKETTFHTCQKHTTKPVHDALKARHASRYPEQHEHLREGSSDD
jgi:hypothetical protein